MSGRVVIVHGLGGETSVYTDFDAEIIEIDEWAPGDRLYRRDPALMRQDAAFLDALIGDGPIGRRGDRPELEQAIRAAKAAAPDGTPRLAVVPRADQKGGV